MTREEVSGGPARGHRRCWAPATSPPSGPAWACTSAARPSTNSTDIRVLLTGEISDELFGYKYTDFAPGAGAFQQESKKRVR